MSIRSELILISLIAMFVLIESQIGSYPALSPTDCGLSRRLPEAETNNCFEWHNTGLTTGQIRNGSNVTESEAPWLVYINIDYTLYNRTYQKSSYSRCSGSLINPQWVLTAGHCIPISDEEFSVRSLKITVMSGQKFVFNEWQRYYNAVTAGNATQEMFNKWLEDNDIVIRDGIRWSIHPNISNRILSNPLGNGLSHLLPVHDLALIQLSTPIEPSPQHRAICLPSEHFLEDDNTYALIGGYGKMGANVSHRDKPGQVTYAKLTESKYEPIMAIVSTEHSGEFCSGDSGGPVWKYYMGRAVLLGVDSFGPNDKHQCYRKGEPASTIRVSYYIDWIIHVTKMDVSHLKETGHRWWFDRRWIPLNRYKNK